MANFTIFGSEGFIGSNLVRSLESSGHVVFRPLRDEPIESNKNLGHVIYCCGITNGDFRKRSSEIVDAHIVNANRVLTGAHFESFLYLSSVRIYDEMTSTFEEQKIPVTLDTASGFYNATKLLGESLVLNHEGPNCRVARLSYVIDVKEDIFFSPILNQLNGRKVSIPWHEKTLKDFVVLEDVLHLVPMIAQNGKKSLYNVASGVNYSMSKVGQLLTSVLDVDVEFSQTEPMRNPSRIDIERITTEFGFKPVDAMDYAKKMISSSVTQ